MMDIEKLIHCLQCCAMVDAHNGGCDDCGLDYCGPECQQLCGTAATALSTLQAENKKLRAELEKVMRERDAAQSLLAERIGVRGAEPITTAFGLPIARLRELAQADREGRCVVLDDLTVADLQQMLTVLDCTRYGDGSETYTTGYRNGHRNGRIEILRHVLGINEGDSAEAEAALRREQDGNTE